MISPKTAHGKISDTHLIFLKSHLNILFKNLNISPEKFRNNKLKDKIFN